jgi:hypothetical protein
MIEQANIIMNGKSYLKVSDTSVLMDSIDSFSIDLSHRSVIDNPYTYRNVSTKHLLQKRSDW